MSAVLLVEDNRLLCKMEERHIAAAFPDVALYVAHNGKEALAAAEACPPDAVVMDCRLPGTGCLELLDEILKISPDAAIIIASADPPKDLTGRSLREKIFGILEKPFETEEFIDILQRAFFGRKADDPLIAPEKAEDEGDAKNGFDRHEMLNALTGMTVLLRAFETELTEETASMETVRESVAEYLPKLIRLVQRAAVQVKQVRE